LLTITPSAVEAIRGVLATVHAPGDSALRLAPSDRAGDGDGVAYDLAVGDAPGPRDCVVPGPGFELYVERDAAPALADKLLDARIERGALRFTLLNEP
jgi:iron-sulfur cluster assembly protein